MKGRLVAAMLVIAALVAAWWMVASVGLRDAVPDAGVAAPSGPVSEEADGPARRGEPQQRHRVVPVAGRVVIAATMDRRSDAGSTDASLPAGTMVYGFSVTDPEQVIGDDILRLATAAAVPQADGSFSIGIPRGTAGQGFVLTARAADGWLSPIVPADEAELVLTLRRSPDAISLRVIDAVEGRPIAGAALRVGWPSNNPFTATRVIARSASKSADDGAATVVFLAGELLEVTAPGFAPALREHPHDGDAVRLARGATIAGVVRAGGSPVAGALVRIREPAELISKTNSAGEFRFDAVDLGYVANLEVEATGFDPRSVDASPGSTDVVVELEPAPKSGPITIRVVGPDGAALAGAYVMGCGRTDESGRVRGEPWAARMTIRAGWPHWLEDVVRGSELHGTREFVESEHTAGADFEVRLSPVPTSFVVVRALDPAGRPIEDAKFKVAGSTGMTPRADGAQVHRVCGPVGTLPVVALVSPGPPEFPAIAPRRVATSSAPAESAADFALPASRRIEVVTDRPDLRLRAARARGPAYPAVANAVTVSLAHPLSGVPFEPVAESADVIAWNVNAGEPVTVRAEGAGIARVDRDLTDAEIAAGRVELRMTTGFAVQARAEAAGADGTVVASGARLIRRVGDRFRGVPAQRIEADGSFRFDNVEPGAWTLKIRYPGSLVAVSRPLDVRSDMDLGTIAVPVPVALRGTVILPDDRPAGGAEVVFTATDADGATAEATTFTLSDGSFELRVPPAAAGTLRISKRGCGTIVALAGGGRTMPPKFRLAPEGQIAVRLGREQRSSLGLRIHVESSGEARDSWVPDDVDNMLQVSIVSSTDDAIRFRGLAPGRILVVAEGPGWRFDAPVTVVAGETAVVTLGE